MSCHKVSSQLGGALLVNVKVFIGLFLSWDVLGHYLTCVHVHPTLRHDEISQQRRPAGRCYFSA